MFRRPAADFIEKLARAPVDIFTLQQVLIRADLTVLTSLTAQGITQIVGVRFPHLLALLAALLLLLLGHLFSEIAHAFAQPLYRFRLAVKGACKIIFAQGFFSLIHRVTGTA